MTAIEVERVYGALEYVADIIREAAGEDGIVCRRHIRAKLENLEGTVRDLVAIFYRFIGHRDARQGDGISGSDIDQTLAYARSKLIEKYDLNHDGLLSEDEIAGMSRTAKLAVQLARELETEQPNPAELLAAELGRLAEGLWFDDFASEYEAPFEPFYRNADLRELNADLFTASMGLDPADPLQKVERFEPADGYFFRLVRDNSEYPPPGMLDAGRRALDLALTMNRKLFDIHAVALGVDDPDLDVEHPVYLVGVTDDGDIVGLKTFAIWT